MKYRLLYHPRCLKRLKKIPEIDRRRVLEKLNDLSGNPFSRHLDIKKLVKTKKGFRLRVGDLRAIFEIEEKDKTIYVWEIDYRGKVY